MKEAERDRKAERRDGEAERDLLLLISFMQRFSVLLSTHCALVPCVSE